MLGEDNMLVISFILFHDIFFPIEASKPLLANILSVKEPEISVAYLEVT